MPLTLGSGCGDCHAVDPALLDDRGGATEAPPGGTAGSGREELDVDMERGAGRAEVGTGGGPPPPPLTSAAIVGSSADFWMA